MQDLNGKTALVLGLANKRSIAYACAERLAQLGATLAVTYQPTDKARNEERIRELTDELSADLALPVDVTQPESIAELFSTLRRRWGRLDVMMHSVAAARRDELGGRHSDISLDGYLFAQHISAYSLIELVRQARPLMNGAGGSVVAMSYIGAVRAANNYNVMGVAKAALEANVRYLAMELGTENIRVNAISAGPIRTLSASGVTDFLEMMRNAREKSALKRDITPEDVANAAAFLASGMSSAITGQTIYVDGGFNIYG